MSRRKYQASRAKRPAGPSTPTIKAPASDPIPVAQNAQEAEIKRRGRGPGRVPAGESFTLVLPPDLLARYRDLAMSQQRSVAQVIRLAMLAYLSSVSEN